VTVSDRWPASVSARVDRWPASGSTRVDRWPDGRAGPWPRVQRPPRWSVATWPATAVPAVAIRGTPPRWPPAAGRWDGRGRRRPEVSTPKPVGHRADLRATPDQATGWRSGSGGEGWADGLPPDGADFSRSWIKQWSASRSARHKVRGGRSGDWRGGGRRGSEAADLRVEPRHDRRRVRPLTWVERHYGYGIARAYAGHTDSTGAATTTYIEADLQAVATALAAMTGQPHPPTRP